jgi:hypothetical protein
MKASTELRAAAATAMTALDTEATRTAYLNGDFPRSESVKDLDKRYRWDLFWAAINTTKTAEIIGKVRSEELDDTHIDTMLRSIVTPLR